MRWRNRGNLTKDKKEGIDSIEWTVYGKIKTITKHDGTVVNYTYDPSGNRISKSVTVSSVTKSTYYVRDASGNVMSIYLANDSLNSGHLTQSELDLYGSSRLGVYNVMTDVQNCQDTIPKNRIFTRGNKFFELSNHLGNVLVTVSDKRIPQSRNNTSTDYYNADIVTANDYYPFGMLMPDRKFAAGIGYRYGFNGKEKVAEITNDDYDFGARIYDARMGRWFSKDELEKKYPAVSPYVFALNSPIHIIDFDGRDIIILSAPKGAGGLGHAAVLIGNDETGWRLYSKNGTYGSSGEISSGPDNNNPEKGLYFKSLSAFANSGSNFHHGEVQYTAAIELCSSVDVDNKMKIKALAQVNKWYDVTGTVTGSCIDVPVDALEAGGFKSGQESPLDAAKRKGYSNGYIGKGFAIEQMASQHFPNIRFERIVEQNKDNSKDVTSQILPTEESKAKFKKEYEDAEALKRPEKKPSLSDKIGNWFDKIGSAISQGAKTVVISFPPHIKSLIVCYEN
ncbi:MAG: RHS repeat-associated core domain-containing protein [Ferruginibacter sp.]